MSVRTTIEIVGANVYVVEKEVKRVSTVPAFVESIQASYNSFDSGWIPTNCRRYYKTNRWSYYLFEFDPRKKLFATIGETGESVERRPYLRTYIPSFWNYFVVAIRESTGFTIGDVWFVTTGERLTTGDEMVYHPLLPNIYPDGRICLGTQTLKSKTLEERVEELLALLFQGNWNLDLSHDISAPLEASWRIKLTALNAELADLDKELTRGADVEGKDIKTKRRTALRREVVEFSSPQGRIEYIYAKAAEAFKIATADPEVNKDTPGYGAKKTFLSVLNPIDKFHKWIAPVLAYKDA